jgi:hypothetical protein
MKTLCGTILVVVAVATCAVGAEHCRPTGELQKKAQALADLAAVGDALVDRLCAGLEVRIYAEHARMGDCFFAHLTKPAFLSLYFTRYFHYNQHESENRSWRRRHE